MSNAITSRRGTESMPEPGEPELSDHRAMTDGVRNVIMRDCTRRLDRVVKQAYDFANARGDTWMGTEHLLVGILREGHSAAALMLEAAGVVLEDMEVTVVRYLRDGE